MDAEEKLGCGLAGFLGACFLFIGVVSFLAGELRLRRYEGSMATDWPVAVFMIVCGLVCLGGSIYAYVKSK